jgi:hypothetical protein
LFELNTYEQLLFLGGGVGGILSHNISVRPENKAEFIIVDNLTTLALLPLVAMFITSATVCLGIKLPLCCTQWILLGSSASTSMILTAALKDSKFGKAAKRLFAE